MRSVPAIAFDYRPSRTLAVVLGAGAILAIIATLASALDPWIKLPLAVVALAYSLWTLALFLRPAIDHVKWHAAGHWRVRAGDARERGGEFVSARTLGSVLVLVLRIGPRRTIALPLLPDNCDGETRRRLRVRLARKAASV